MLDFDYGLIYCLSDLIIFLFENDQKKPLNRRYRITQKYGLTHFNDKNKYSLFGRTLPISVIMLQ